MLLQRSIFQISCQRSKVIEKLSYVAMEFERLDGFASVDVNMETEEFSYNFLYEPTEYTIIESMQEISIDEIHSHGYCVGFGNSIDLPHDDSVSWGEFSEMLRIEGVIYCVAP